MITAPSTNNTRDYTNLNFRLRAIVPLLLCLILSGCVARLPERTDLTLSAIPELDKNKARVFIFMGTYYLPSGFGGYYEMSLAKGVDVKVFIDGEYVNYVSEDAIIVDLAPGTYTFNHQLNGASEEYDDRRKSVPYELSLSPAQIVYLEANIKDTSSQTSAWIGGLGGAIGGAIHGANIKFADYFEVEQGGGQIVSQMGIAEYVNLSTVRLSKEPSGNIDGSSVKQ